MAGCSDNTCGTEFSSLPLLTGCPGDDETFLVSNAVGGVGVGRYGRRTWGVIKACATAGSRYASLSATITSITSDTYTNVALIGATKIEFIIINKQLYTYADGDFSFNNIVGTISFLTITLFQGDKIVIPYSSS